MRSAIPGDNTLFNQILEALSVGSNRSKNDHFIAFLFKQALEYACRA